MREENIVFIKKVLTEHPGNFKGPVVEVGSYLVEGQEELADLRPIFEGINFTGCDFREGPGVDRIEDAHRLTYRSNSVGTVLCIDTLEHIENPFLAVKEMYRILKPGGICVLVSVMKFPIHDYPSDYWRFTPEGFKILLKSFDNVYVESDGDPKFPTGIYGYGIKTRRYSRSADLFWRMCAKLKNTGVRVR